MTSQKRKSSAQKNKQSAPLRAYETVVAKIRILIEEQKLGPGDILPPERQLADQFKVSRHSLREAIRVLQEQGVLAARQGSGNFIQATSRADLIRALGFSTKGNTRKMFDLFQLRDMLEPQIAGIAAEMATEKQVGIIKDLAAKLEQSEDFDESQKLDQALHEAIASATGNELLYDILREINAHILPTANSASEKQRRTSISNDGHRRIIKALEERDADAARQAMHRHILEIRSEIL